MVARPFLSCKILNFGIVGWLLIHLQWVSPWCNWFRSCVEKNKEQEAEKTVAHKIILNTYFWYRMIHLNKDMYVVYIDYYQVHVWEYMAHLPCNTSLYIWDTCSDLTKPTNSNLYMVGVRQTFPKITFKSFNPRNLQQDPPNGPWTKPDYLIAPLHLTLGIPFGVLSHGDLLHPRCHFLMFLFTMPAEGMRGWG